MGCAAVPLPTSHRSVIAAALAEAVGAATEAASGPLPPAADDCRFSVRAKPAAAHSTAAAAEPAAVFPEPSDLPAGAAVNAGATVIAGAAFALAAAKDELGEAVDALRLFEPFSAAAGSESTPADRPVESAGDDEADDGR